MALMDLVVSSLVRDKRKHHKELTGGENDDNVNKKEQLLRFTLHRCQVQGQKMGAGLEN